MTRALLLILSFQMVFQPLAAYGQNEIQEEERVEEEPVHSLIQDPILSQFEHADQIPMELGLPKNDPSLDADPFFMTNQDWIPNTQNEKENSSGVTVTETGSQVLISVPMVKASVVVNQPLNMIASTDEFIYFSARRNFPLFEKESAGLESVGEGIFFVSRDELMADSYQKLHVPFYFIPLPGAGWREIDGAYLEKNDTVMLIDNDGDPLPLPVSWVRDVYKAEKFNLLLAQVTTYGFHPHGGTAELRRVLPSPGITAGFGSLFTGIDSVDPSNSLFATADQPTLMEKISNLLALARDNLWIPRAQAQTAGFHLDPKLQKRLLRVAVVVGVSLVASVVFKLFVYRKYFKEKHAADGPRSFSRQVRDHVTDTADIFAHTLTTFSQVAPVLFANTLEFLGDRYFPQLGSSNNSLMRKFLNRTVYFVRDINDRVPVSGKTWLYGAVLLGGIDTFFVYVQLYHVVPWLGAHLAQSIPALQSRVNEAFSIGNPQIATMNQNDVIKNAASALTTGASGVSQDLQAQFMERVKGEIRDDMKKEGKNPDLKDKPEFDIRVSQRLDQELQKMGSPSKKDFLFDMNSIYAAALATLGYGMAPELDKAGFKPEEIMGLKRTGLVISSAAEAISRLRLDSSPYSGEALRILGPYSKDLNLLTSFIKVPFGALMPKGSSTKGFGSRVKQYAKQVTSTRQAFLMLTYDGDFEKIKSYLPDEWQKFSPEALNLAAKTFSEVFSETLNGKPVEKAYTPPIKDFIARNQERKANRIASEKFLSEKGYSFNVAVATAEDSVAYKQLYTQSQNQILGLYPDYREKPEIEDEVSDLAIQYTKDDLNKPDVQVYLKTVEPEARFQFEADVQATNFVKAYKNLISASGKFSQISPSQPGRFQKLRQSESVRNSPILTRLLRVAEAFTAGDRIATGKTAWLDRKIPGWYDFKKTNLRVYSGAITAVMATYWINWAVWGLHLPWSLWTLYLVSAWTINAPSQFLTRVFSYQGAKPQGKAIMMVAFALVYTWATFWGSIPEQIFQGDFVTLFNQVMGHWPELLFGASLVVTTAVYKDTIKEHIKKAVEKTKAAATKSFYICVGTLNSF